MVNTPFVYTKSPPQRNHKSRVKNVKRIIVIKPRAQSAPAYKYFFGEFALRRLYST